MARNFRELQAKMAPDVRVENKDAVQRELWRIASIQGRDTKDLVEADDRVTEVSRIDRPA